MSTKDSDGNSSDGVECPTCGSDGFKNERGVKSHHKQVHGEPLDTDEDLLDYIKSLREELGRTPTVDDVRERTEYTPQKYTRRFGGWNAAVEAAGFDVNLRRDISKEELLSELESLAEELGETPRTDDMTEKGKFAVKAYDRYFGTWTDALLEVGLDPIRRVDISEEVDCYRCGKTIERTKYALDRNDSHYCTRECMLEYRKGDKHPRWDGGFDDYGPGFDESKKEAVRERDNRECVNCGRSEEEHIDKIGRKHSVHHIQKASSFDDPEKRNAMDNLVTLCETKECHSKWEAMSPLRPVVE